MVVMDRKSVHRTSHFEENLAVGAKQQGTTLQGCQLSISSFMAMYDRTHWHVARKAIYRTRSVYGGLTVLWMKRLSRSDSVLEVYQACRCVSVQCSSYAFKSFNVSPSQHLELVWESPSLSTWHSH